MQNVRRAVAGTACALLFAGCTQSLAPNRFDMPDADDPCQAVDLTDGEIDGSPEFRNLFDCLNNLGDLESLAPVIDDLEATTNPETGLPYLDDVATMTNLALGYPDVADVVPVVQNLVEDEAIRKMTPLGAEIIDTGLAAALLPVVQAGIDSGEIPAMLPAVSDLLRDPDLPALTASTKDLLDDGIADGWIDELMADTATLLTVTDGNGQPALRPVLEAGTTFLAGGGGEDLIPVVDVLLDDGTLNELAAVSRSLYDQGVLHEMDTQMRPLFVQDASGFSDMQGLLAIQAGTNGPLKCIGITVTDNLAEMILGLMADRTEADIQNLVGILESTLGLADLFCSLPPEVQEHIDSLDALANSGALNGMLPMLKVFKAQDRIPELNALLVQLHDSGAMPALEPVLVVAIDEGVTDRAADTLPTFIDPNGQLTDVASTTLQMLDQLISPRVGTDYGTAPASGVLTILGEAAGPASVPVADGLYELGLTIQTEGSGFQDLPPALSAALGADPDGVFAQVGADLIDAGAADRALPPLAESIRGGHLDKVLPWVQQVLEDGTVDELVELLAGTLELLDREE